MATLSLQINGLMTMPSQSMDRAQPWGIEAGLEYSTPRPSVKAVLVVSWRRNEYQPRSTPSGAPALNPIIYMHARDI